MSSHREAPEISKDPVADSTDLYVFTSYGNPDNVTIIANYVPLQSPEGGPNFYEFGDDVLYEINIDNNGDGNAEIIYQFTFTTQVTNPTRSCTTRAPSCPSPTRTGTAGRRSRSSRVDVKSGKKQTLGTNLSSPPCNIGPLSTPNYEALVTAAIHPLPGGGNVFAGQRGRGLLRRSRRDLRPGHPPSVRAAPHHVRPAEHRTRLDGGRRELHHGRERALDRARRSRRVTSPRTGAKPTDATSPASVIGVWTDGQPPEGTSAQGWRYRRLVGSVRAGLTAG